MVIDIQSDAVGVADSLVAQLLIGHSDVELLGPFWQLGAWRTEQVLAGALEVKLMPIQGDVVGVTPGLALGYALWLAAVLARGLQGTLFTFSTPGGHADQRATGRFTAAPLGAGGVGPELAAPLIVDAVFPAATAILQGHTAVAAQHEACVALAALDAGTLAQGGGRGVLRG